MQRSNSSKLGAIASLRHKWLKLRRRARYGVVTLLALLLVLAYVVGGRISVNSEMEISLVASQGRTTIGLASELNPVSPGCGCVDPKFGTLRWYGMSLPSQGFDLSVATSPSRLVAGPRWVLEAMAPDQDVVDWYGAPIHTLYVRVTDQRDGTTSQLFAGRTTYLALVTEGSVHVTQPSSDPYAALLPAAGGATAFTSTPGPFPQSAAAVDVETSAPARGSAYQVFRGDDSSHPALAQHGPMIDVIGPTITLSFNASHASQIYTGLDAVPGVRAGDSLRIAVTTPYSVRLFPYPAQATWLASLAGWWQRMVHLQRTKRTAEPRQQFDVGPRFQGRYVVTQPLPRYSVRLSNLEVPDDPSWASFVARSASKQIVAPMLSNSATDNAVIGYTTTEYGLPPVSAIREIGVFGQVTRFSSDAVSGRAVVNSKPTLISNGQKISLASTHGLTAGAFQLTPLVSEGDPTGEANIYGSGRLNIGGTTVTGVSWLPWLLGAIGAALVGLLLADLLAWARRASVTAVEEP